MSKNLDALLRWGKLEFLASILIQRQRETLSILGLVLTQKMLSLDVIHNTNILQNRGSRGSRSNMEYTVEGLVIELQIIDKLKDLVI